MSIQPASTSLAPLYWLAVGTFAVGTESFMIAGLLPAMAADLHVTVSTAGQLVTAFALAYAIGSPVLTAVTARVARRRLLIAAMVAFAGANMLAWAAAGYWQLMAARIVLAFAAGIYVPAANAVASAVAQPGRRGSALAIVNGGLSLAIAIGVPLGALLGNAAGWRTTFAGVAVLSALAAAGLSYGLPRSFGAGLAVASLASRLRTAAQPAILRTLLVTTLWAMASYTTYTYLAAFIGRTTNVHGGELGYILFGWGVAAAAGLAISARIIDSRGALAVIVPALAVSTASFLLLSASAHFLPRAVALAPVLLAILAWGVAHWAFYPAQQTTLAEVAGAAATPIVLSLNASFMYLGFSLGAGVGAVVIAWSSPVNLGFASALCMFGAIALARFNTRTRKFLTVTTPA